MKNNSFFLLVFSLFLISCHSQQHSSFKDGDIIFQPSFSQQSRAVEIATNSPYSHCGILFFEDGKPYVYEAIQPVGKRPLADWIAAGVNGEFVVKRLKNEELLTPEMIASMKNYAFSQFGKNYDAVFNWSDNEMYCSELVWKIYHLKLGIKLAQPLPLRDFNIDHVEVRKIMQQRYGKNIPYDEKMVSPAQIYDSPLLKTVAP
jgi:hypothetical protein